MLGYLSADIICLFREAHSFPGEAQGNCELRGTDNVCYKHPSIFLKLNGGYGEYSPVLAGRYSIVRAIIFIDTCILR